MDLDLEVFSGHGSYVAGEETAMLESMQGRPAMPRQKPPFYPTDFGLYGKPTLVNNVETLCNIPQILKNGAAWFTQVGTEKCPGTMLFSLSGSVNRPGVYEMPMGITIRDLIETCGGGVPNGRKIKAVFPGGPAFSMVTADQLDSADGFRFLKKAGTGLGSAGTIVIDDATCMVAATPQSIPISSRVKVADNVPCAGWVRSTLPHWSRRSNGVRQPEGLGFTAAALRICEGDGVLHAHYRCCSLGAEQSPIVPA